MIRKKVITLYCMLIVPVCSVFGMDHSSSNKLIEILYTQKKRVKKYRLKYTQEEVSQEFVNETMEKLECCIRQEKRSVFLALLAKAKDSSHVLLADHVIRLQQQGLVQYNGTISLQIQKVILSSVVNNHGQYELGSPLVEDNRQHAR